MFWTLLLASLSTYYIWSWYRHKQMLKDLIKRCVFITGCDTGLGHDLALKLDAMGVPVFAGCLTKTGAENLAAETSTCVHTVLVDVKDQDSIQSAYQYVKEHIPDGAEFWGIVNNAGIRGGWGPLEFLTLHDFREAFEVNFLGMVAVIKTFLPLLKRSGGRIVNTSSTAAVLPVPGISPYGCTKSAIRGLSTDLRLEKACFGIKTACVMPGSFKTKISDHELNKKEITAQWENLPAGVREEFGKDFFKQNLDRWIEMLGTPTEDTSPVVNAYVHALFARWPQLEYTAGADSTLIFTMSKVLPKSWYEFIVRTLFYGTKYLAVTKTSEKTH